MHRGKVHQSGGESAFGPSPAFIEVYEKLDSPRNGKIPEDYKSSVKLPRHKMIIPFNQAKVLPDDHYPEGKSIECKRGTPVTFEIRKVLLGEDDEEVCAFYAENVRIEYHPWWLFYENRYFKAGLKAASVAFILLSILDLLALFINSGSKEFSESIQNLVVLTSIIIINLAIASFLVLTIILWVGHRTSKGGLQAGLIIGSLLVIIFCFDIHAIGGIVELGKNAFYMILYLIKFILAGWLIGYLIQSKRSGPPDPPCSTSVLKNPNYDEYEVT